MNSLVITLALICAGTQSLIASPEDDARAALALAQTKPIPIPKIRTVDGGKVIIEEVKPAFPSWKIASESVLLPGAALSKTPIAVFVGIPARLVPGVLPCMEPQGFAGITKGIIAAIPNGSGGFRQVDLFPNATDDEIIDATRAKVRQSPSFFRQGSLLEFLRSRRTADVDPQTRGPWVEGIEFPKGMVRYRPARFTQEIAVTNGRDRISPVPIENIASKWHQPGGLEGLTGWKSDLYKFLPENGQTWVGNIPVWNGSNFQNNRGYLRAYPAGTEFHDVLSNDDGKIFAHRIAVKKEDGSWERFTAYRDKDAEPPGYVHIKTNQCSSCHNEAGTGGYATGLVSGGDTILSDGFPELESAGR